MTTQRANPTIHVSPPTEESEPPEADASPLGGDAAEAIHAARERASEALETTRAWIVANPTAALGITLGAGFLVGRVVRR